MSACAFRLSMLVSDCRWSGHPLTVAVAVRLQINAVSLYLLYLVEMISSGLQIVYNTDEVRCPRAWSGPAWCAVASSLSQRGFFKGVIVSLVNTATFKTLSSSTCVGRTGGARCRLGRPRRLRAGGTRGLRLPQCTKPHERVKSPVLRPGSPLKTSPSSKQVNSC